jgi:hypothetical protein
MFPFPPAPPTGVGRAASRTGFPHSDIRGSPGGWPLPAASRSRPTSFLGSTAPGHPPSAVSRVRPTRPRSCDLSYASSRCSLGNVHHAVRPAAACARRAWGGDEGIRTPALLRAREALSLLSYIPQPRPSRCPPLARGGPFWTRTRDLSLIRTALSPTELKALGALPP